MPTTISIDASVAVKLIVEEPLSAVADKIVEDHDFALAPAHAYAEIVEIVYRKTRDGMVDRRHAEDSIRSLPETFTLVPLHTIMVPAFRIALSLRHSVYDCLYLSAAELHGVKLITDDRKLLRKVQGTPYSGVVLALESFSSAP